MRRVILATALLLAPVAASAETAQPITLSANEYLTVINELAQRDPVMKLLLDKQQQAQQQAAIPSPAPSAAKPDAAAK